MLSADLAREEGDGADLATEHLEQVGVLLGHPLAAETDGTGRDVPHEVDRIQSAGRGVGDLRYTAVAGLGAGRGRGAQGVRGAAGSAPSASARRASNLSPDQLRDLLRTG